MQKIIIKNFRQISYAEIEIKDFLFLIGEQASGKSTIAKLIYFFKSLKQDYFNLLYDAKNRSLSNNIVKYGCCCSDFTIGEKKSFARSSFF